MKKKKVQQWAIARKNSPYVIMTLYDYEKALELIKGKENLMEVRKVIV